MPKPPCHRVVVAALIEDGHGAYLIQERPPGSWGAGSFEFPGGSVDEGENPRVALVRECQEELGIRVEAGDIYDVRSHTYDYGMIILVFVSCSIIEGNPTSREGNKFRWATPAEMDALPMLPADVPLIPSLKSTPAVWKPAP